MNEVFTCSHCHTEHPASERTVFDDQELCFDCLTDQTVRCHDCGRLIWLADNEGSERHPLCSDCFDRCYTRCQRCGGLLHLSSACYTEDDEDEDYPFCSVCYTEVRDVAIHNYYFKPEVQFYGEGPRYYGVELEIDEGGESEKNAKEFLSIANECNELMYIKHDSSLEDGMELVTHPMSLTWHKTHMPWQAVMKRAIELGYLSHQTRTCGLHIHASRAALGETEAEQEAVIARILWFFEKHWEEILKASRRSQRNLDRWAHRYQLLDSPKKILDHVKGGHADRYTCVNVLNDATIEFRIFRGTLRYNSLIAALQLVDRIIDCAMHFSDEEMQQLAWTTFAAGCTERELVTYLKERRLYVNDLVVGGEEV